MDDGLQELERRWLESRSTEAGLALLEERRRLGELRDSNLELAAYLGGPLSRQLLGSKAPPPEERPPPNDDDA